MKKIAFLMSALALVVFASCDNKENGGSDFENLIEDGWYVAGAATGYEGVSTKCMMTPAKNEANKQTLREGMYEKYLVLEAGKTFTVQKYVNEEKAAEYGASLASWDVTKYSDYPVGETVLLGELNENAITVEETGLYYVAIDLNSDGALKYPQMVLTKVNWGAMGGSSAWGSIPFEASELKNGSITYTATGVECRAGFKFKFRCNDGWKIFLDAVDEDPSDDAAATTVAVNINLGTGLQPGASDIEITDGAGIYNITLTFTQSAGAVENSFSYSTEKTGEVTILDPSTFVVGFSGANLASGWGDPAGDCVATYNASASTVTDTETKAGTYVYETTATVFDGEFKVRINGGWHGGEIVQVTGVEASGDGDITLGTSGTYAATVTFVWDGGQVTSVKLALTAA